MIAPPKKISRENALQIYRHLLLPRLIEKRMLSLLRQNKIGKWFSGIGQEAIAVGTTLSLSEDDYILPMHRNLGVFTTRNVPLYPLFCQLFGREDGFTGGRDRSFHFGIEEKKIFGMISHLAATMPVANGIALGFQLKGRDQVAVSFCGDGATSEKRMIEAIQLAHRQAFDEDDSFILLGQDIAEYGGVFKVSEGFVEQFGKERIRNTPIIESGAVGAAIGLAMNGFKPVLEMQFADFISCGFNQIVNNLSKGHYRWMPNIKVTIRAPHGGGVGGGPFHSQSPESWFMQFPGLRVLVPSSVSDAQNMLYTALFDPNPVLFFEHKKLYRSIREVTNDRCEFVDLEKASIMREGRDVSIIIYGMGVHWAMEVVDEYQDRGVDLEILDLRSLAPIDWESIIKTVQKTGRVLLLEEPSEVLGPMSEISAGISEKAFEYLDAPVLRCSSIHTPIPFNKELEKGYLANYRLKEKLNQLIQY